MDLGSSRHIQRLFLHHSARPRESISGGRGEPTTIIRWISPKPKEIEAFEDTWHWNESAEDAFGRLQLRPEAV
jgi:hypothetical protein